MAKKYMVECKFHNRRGIKTHIKVAMYTYARFLDLKEYFDAAWLICNTKCTSKTIEYRCMEIKNTSWAYPPGRWSLENMIERKHLYPITIPMSLNDQDKRLALKFGIITTEDLVNKGPKILVSAGIKEKIALTAHEEAEILLNFDVKSSD